METVAIPTEMVLKKQGCGSGEREAAGGEAAVDRCFVYTKKLRSNEGASTLSGKGSCFPGAVQSEALGLLLWVEGRSANWMPQATALGGSPGLDMQLRTAQDTSSPALRADQLGGCPWSPTKAVGLESTCVGLPRCLEGRHRTKVMGEQ